MPTFGKIALLPIILRNAVNRMLDDNVAALQIAERINASLKKSQSPEIASVELSDQNVNNWRNGGYRKWQAESKTREMAEKITLVRADGKNVTDRTVADNISAVILGELAVVATNLVEGKLTDKQRKETIEWLVPQVTALRRGETARSWLRLETMKLELAINRAAAESGSADTETLHTGKRQGHGISDETMSEIEMATGIMDDENYEYKFLTPEQVEEIREEAREKLRNM